MTAEKEVTKTSIPAGVKLPDDHKPADNGHTYLEWAGKKWDIEDAAFDDIDFLEAAESALYVACAKILLGAEQFQQFREHLRDKTTGRAKASELVKFVEAASDKFNAKN